MSKLRVGALLACLPVLSGCGPAVVSGATLGPPPVTAVATTVGTALPVSCPTGQVVDPSSFVAALDRALVHSTAHVHGALTSTQAAASFEVDADVDTRVKDDPKAHVVVRAQGRTIMESYLAGGWIYARQTDKQQGYLRQKAAGAPTGLLDFTDPYRLTRLGGTKVVCGPTRNDYGVSVSTYRVSIDMSKAEVTQAAAFPPEVDQDVLVDAQGRPRRIMLDWASGSLSVGYSKWGEPVTITPPPPDQVKDAPAGSGNLGV